MTSDKERERIRYDEYAESKLKSNTREWKNPITEMPLYLRDPYDQVLSFIQQRIGQQQSILEIGAGTGVYTGFLLETGAEVYAIDISGDSVQYMRSIFYLYTNFQAIKADIEALPFADKSFDYVINFGALSYGDNDVVLNMIHRVLKPGGSFISLDSYNENPIYRLNRYIHYLKGNRSKSTLKQMPGKKFIKSYQQTFTKVTTKFFGSFLFLVPFFKAMKVSENRIYKLIKKLDALTPFKKLGFKFFLIAQK